MVYGYVRVSTDRQTVDNQRFEIERFCSKNSIAIDKWIEETISGTQLPEKRLLGSLLSEAKTGDLIVCSELSRLGRNMFMIMSILNHFMINGVKSGRKVLRWADPWGASLTGSNFQDMKRKYSH